MAKAALQLPRCEICLGCGVQVREALKSCGICPVHWKAGTGFWEISVPSPPEASWGYWEEERTGHPCPIKPRHAVFLKKVLSRYEESWEQST